jgi:soluble lytic murein transglycosylase
MIIVDAAAKYPDIDHLTLCALIAHESRFNPHALSPVKAKGLTQIMDQTARNICYRFAWNYYDSIAFNPEKNVLMGAYYLSTLISENKGNIELALAEFNDGEIQRVRYSFMKDKERGEILDSAQEQEIKKIPQETKEYPGLVLAKEKELRDKYSFLYKEEKVK